jgi:hypothetical protein
MVSSGPLEAFEDVGLPRCPDPEIEKVLIAFETRKYACHCSTYRSFDGLTGRRIASHNVEIRLAVPAGCLGRGPRLCDACE